MTRRLVCSICLILCGVASAAEVPYGHEDFYPSPERPIGHRGDGSGWFPGARPVGVWSDGPAIEVEMEIPDKWGRSKKQKAWDFTGSNPTNVVWRTEMPAWANTQPLVVGDRVFSYGEPDLIFCVDARDGTLLWQRRLSPWRCAGLPEADVQRAEVLYDVYLALDTYRLYRLFSGSTIGSPPRKEVFPRQHQTFVETCLPRMLAACKQADPRVAWDEAAAGSVQKSEAVLAGVLAGDKKIKRLRRTKDLRDLIEQRIGRIGDLELRLDPPWGHMVGHQMSCPVSDGERLYVQMGQGQVAALDLNGEIAWAALLPRGKGNELHIRSPLLAEGVLVTSIGGDVLRGVEASSGKVLWEAPFPAAGSRSAGSDAIVALGRGAERTKVVVTTHCNVIRVADGKVLGVLPFAQESERGLDGGPSIISRAMQDGSALVWKGATGDGGSSPYVCFRIRLAGEDFVAEKVYDLGQKSSPTIEGVVATDRYLLLPSSDADIVEPETGQVLHATAMGRLGTHSLVVAGDLAIGHDDLGPSNGWGRRRPDQKMLCRFWTMDMSDPKQPRLVSDANILGGDHLPRDPAVERYMPELWQDETFVNGCGGRISHFIYLDTGMMPSANRIFIRSTGHLYCIGNPQQDYSWNPVSRPERLGRALAR